MTHSLIERLDMTHMRCLIGKELYQSTMIVLLKWLRRRDDLFLIERCDMSYMTRIMRCEITSFPM